MRKGNARFGKRDMGYVQTLNSLVLGLFASGEPGFWLDPSDLSTMYQDSAGTTPVTAVEQPVGLILDKSKGLVQGVELVTNGNFVTNTSGWTISEGDGTFVGNGGSATLTFGTVATAALYAFTATIGKWYYVSYTILANIDGGVTGFQFYGNVGGADVSFQGGLNAGTYHGFMYATSTTGFVWVRHPFAGSVTITGVSVKSVAGTHYYQSTAGVRPVLSARVNLLTKTELWTAPWTIDAGLTSATVITAPDGTNTACSILNKAGTSSHQFYQSSTISTTTITNSVLAAPGTVGWLGVAFNNSAAVDGAFFNLSTGALGTVTAGATATITAHPQYAGWYICTVSRTYTAGTKALIIEAHTADNQSSTYSAAGTETVKVWHPDLRPSDQATGLIPTYQRVNTSTDYDTAGFPLYLSGNGTQWMQCATQDYTGVNKMLVCAGVRKRSDAAASVLLELSTIVTNAGTFAIYAPNSPGEYVFPLNGTALSGQIATTFNAPITNVLSVAYDISQASAALETIPRVNGATPTLALFGAASAGTGNFGNYPAYLFCRAGTSLFLTGNIYGLVARGSTVASNAAQIAATENWTDSKCRAY